VGAARTEPAGSSPLESFEILGVRVHAVDVVRLHEEIGRAVASGRRTLVLHANAHGLNLAHRERWLRDVLNAGDIVFCDGKGVEYASRFLGGPRLYRITYADWMWQLAAFAEASSISLYLLGAAPGVTELAAEKLRARCPKLRIAGTGHGYFDQSPGSTESGEVVARINAARPDVLLVGFGMPLQERWLQHYWPALECRVALTAGACFDYASGRLRRAPLWLAWNGFEWLGRLIIEPRRLWRRYLLGNPYFVWLVLRQRLGLLSR
jgi:N-acetylglucosaminyldiphosphoundecaprenol N-acetyl-beta-D-mannosaminyltransferase